VTSSRPTVEKVLATRDPHDRCWEMPEPPVGGHGATVTLFGWVMDARPIDAGVPPLVAEILAGALTSRYKLTFLDPGATEALPLPDRWSPSPSGWVRTLRAGGLSNLVGAPVFPLLSTNLPEVATRLFFASGFCWEHRAQIVVLSCLASEPPNLSYGFYDLWLRHRQIDARAIANERRAEGLLIPGPDGDFAGLLIPNPDTRDQMLTALAEQCGTANVEFAVVTNEEFRSTRWYLSDSV
jgi:hypothetical protein